jgi:hypothetical protein
MVLMLRSSVHSIGSQMHNGRADLLFPTTHRNGRRAIILRGWARRTARPFYAVTGIDADTVAIFHDLGWVSAELVQRHRMRRRQQIT